MTDWRASQADWAAAGCYSAFVGQWAAGHRDKVLVNDYTLLDSFLYHALLSTLPPRIGGQAGAEGGRAENTMLLHLSIP